MGHKGAAGYHALLSQVIWGTYTPSRGSYLTNILLMVYVPKDGPKNTQDCVIRVPSAHRRVMRVLGFNEAKNTK